MRTDLLNVRDAGPPTRATAAGDSWQPWRLRRIVLVLLLPLVLVAPAGATRLAGETRYDTAAEVARAAFASSAGAVLVRGDEFPDALAAAGVAGVLDAPILLTDRDELSVVTADSLRALGVREVTILGGTAAVSSGVEEQLRAMAIGVGRLAGGDRYATAAAAAGESSTMLLASGESFADALAAGPLAFTRGLPIVLTRRDDLPDATAGALRDVDDVIVVGGTAAVSDEVAAEVEALGASVRRIAGPSRQATAIAVAAELGGVRVALARADTFPDALAAAALGLPILLAGDATTAWLDEHPVAVTTVGAVPAYRWRPAIGDTWHLQLQGELVTDVDVDVFDIDLFDTSVATIDALHADGRRVVCYVSAGSWEEWRDDADDWPASVLGNDLDGWEGERWVDARALDVLGPLMEARFDLAAEKGCDAVDPDNVDGYSHDTGFPLTEDDLLAYNRLLVREAHERGLGVGLRNALELVPELADEVDFAVNEQCVAFDECDVLAPYAAAGHPVFGVEYEGEREQICDVARDVGAWLLADLALDGGAQVC